MTNSLTVSAKVDVANTSKEVKTMTTKELAGVLGVEPRTVRNAVDRLDLGKVLSQVKINGKSGYVFTEEQATLIKREIQKHHNLENRQIEAVQTEIEVIQNAAFSIKSLLELVNAKTQENEALKTENYQMKTKAIYFDDFMSSKGKFSFTQAANDMKIGRDYLISFLLSNKFIYREKSKELAAYKKYLDKEGGAGLFTTKEWGKGELSGLQTCLTPKGIEYFKKILNPTPATNGGEK